MYRYTTNFILLFCVFLLVNLAKAQELSFQTIDPQRITIVRDNWGVPHIKAPTNAEVAYGLAWAHAEDDFASMQEMYALGTGNLARLKGAKAAPADFLQKLLRIDVLVETQYETAISNEFKQYLDGFCQGLNAFAKAHPQEVRLKKLFPQIGRASCRERV